MYKRIVVGYDGSDAAKKAVDHAVQLAAATGASVLIAWGVEFSHLPRATAAMKPLVDDALSAAEEGARLVAEECEGRCSLVDAVVIPEAPVDALIRAAADANADLIVVGTRGRRLLASGVMGSTAYGLLHRSALPVLVVPVH